MMTRKIKLGCFILFTIVPMLFLSAQEFNPDYLEYHAKVAPETPNAATFTVYGDTPVNNATGVPQINIPIFTLVEDGVSVPISLSYHASGIKVDELSGVVGLKWTLNAGGGVFRQVNDKQDETGWLDPAQRGIVNPTWLANQGTLNDKAVQDLISFSAGFHDYYPDDFSYNFPGQSGSFIFDLNGNVAQEQETAVKIQKINGTGNLIDFRAFDGQGNTFYFDGDKEFNTQNVIVGGNTQGDLSFNSSTYTAGWMLDRILTKNNKHIDFSYTPYELTYTINDVAHSISQVVECIPVLSSAACGCEGQGNGISRQISKTSIVYSPLNRLPSTIESANVRVTFNYEDDSTLATWQKKLTSIIILDKIGNKTKSFTFTYGKYAGDARLRLDEIQEIGFDGTTKPPYKFYYQAGSLPEKGSLKKDYFGFYNGRENSGLVPFSAWAYNTLNNTLFRSYLGDRNENVDYIKIGVLNKIKYPTGGSTEFNYEPNVLPATDNTNPTYVTKSVSVSNQTYTSTLVSGQYTLFRSPFTISNEFLSTIGSPVSYNGSSSICAFDPDLPNIDCSQFNIYPVQGPIVVTSQPVFNPNKIVWADGSENLPTGDYMLELRVKTSDLTANPNALIEENLSWIEEKPVSERTKYTGGLRVSTIRDKNSNGVLVKQTDYSYSDLVGYSLDISNTIKGYGAKSVFSADNIALNPALIKSGYYYGTVTIDQIGSEGNIRTIEKYEETYKNKSHDPQMVRQEFYNGDHMVRSLDMEYSNTIENTLQFWTLGDVDYCYNAPTFPPTNILERLGYNNPNSSNYFHRRNTLSETTDITYFNDPNEPFSASVTISRYDYNQHLQMKQQELDGRYTVLTQQEANNKSFTLQGEGEYIKVDYTYVNDHISEDAVINTLNNNYLISLPVSKKTYNKNNLVLGQFMEYDALGNIMATYRYNRGKETNNAVAGHIPADYKRYQQYRTIDGRPVEIKRDNGISTTLLWDASDTYLLAKIDNADYDQITALNSFNDPLNLTSTGLTSTQENELRGLPNSMVTTYTYDTLVGLISSTDPNENKVNYEYDGLSRLKAMRDLNNDIISDYQYHYKGQ